MKTKIGLKAGETLANTQQTYQSLIIVVSKALGGKSTTSAPDPATMPNSVDQLEATLARHF